MHSRRSKLLAALTTAALFAASAAVAAEPAVYGHAKLATALAAPKSESLGGLDWKCEGDACVATAKGSPASWSSMYACKKIAGTFGALASLELSGQTMSAGNLAVCNKAAAH
ncbi:MAG TPA: hypothetical protein VG939_19165 [Caulobacteraceae bacterium]|nr:hypothetical protein [Caulobacteraceae bacterium]